MEGQIHQIKFDRFSDSFRQIGGFNIFEFARKLVKQQRVNFVIEVQIRSEFDLRLTVTLKLTWNQARS